MSTRRLILIAAVVLVVFVGGYWYRHRRVALYGGLKPYMQNLARLHATTAKALHGASQLPLDFTPMEQLSQTAQDIVGVFGDNPLARNPSFTALATQQIRCGAVLEASWDAGRMTQARQAFINLTNNCNACHRQLSNRKISDILFNP